MTKSYLGLQDELSDFGLGFVTFNSRDWEILSANSEFSRWVGWNGDRQRLTYFVQPHFHDEFSEAVAVALRDQKTTPYELAFNDRNGEELWVDVLLRPNQDTNPQRNIVSSVAIPRRDQIERGHVHSIANHFDIAQAQAKCGSWEINLESMEGWWSRQLYDVYGLEPSDVPPTMDEFLQLLHPEDAEKVRAHNRNIGPVGSAKTVDLRTNPTLGPMKYLRSAVETVERNGALVLVGTTQDITEQRRLLHKIRENENKYRQIIENAGEGIIVVDHQGVIVEINPHMANMLGYTVDEMRGKPVSDFSLSADIHIEETFESQSQQCPPAAETTMIRKDGRHVWTLASWSPIRGASGEVLRARGTMVNISHQKQMEEIAKNAAVARTKLDMLSDKEKSVFDLVVQGHLNKRIARLLDISEATVERRRASLLKKLRVDSVAELVRISVEAESMDHPPASLSQTKK